MKILFPLLVLILIFFGLFLLGRYATKKAIPPHPCIMMCGNGKCDGMTACAIPPCICPEYPHTCAIDCS